MIVTIDLDELPIDAKAEYLRGLVFNQRWVRNYNVCYRQVGCYSTFEVNDGFAQIEPSKYSELYNKFKPPEETDAHFGGIGKIEVSAYESETIVAMWWWDGDGSLLIWVKGEPYAYVNTDCKCDYGWREVELP